MKNLIKSIVFLAAIVALATMVGCSKHDFLYGNHYIQFYPGDMKTLYVKHGPGNYNAEPNGENYQVEYLEYEENGVNMFRLSVISFDHDINFAWFSGYDNTDATGQKDMDEEMEWKQDGRTFSYTGELLPAKFYEISLSKKNY